MSAGNTDSSHLQAHLGTWTNWSRGQVFGATLTLRQSDANLLIAFTAFFVAYVGVRLWRILCFALHFLFSSRLPQDGVYHQRQVMLRNSSTPEAAFVLLLELFWAWRRKASYLTRRLLPLALLTAASVVGFTLAGGFSSKISSLVSSEVLLVGDNCVIFDTNKVQNTTSYILSQYYNPYKAQNVANAASYAAQCYGKDTSAVMGCETFLSDQIPFTIERNASCPFQPSLCKNQTGNLQLDTGFLDSHEHFGINAPPSYRFQYRRLYSCAPLVTAGHTSVFNVSADRSYTRYYYGRSHGGEDNYTMEFSNDAYFETQKTNFTDPSADYSLGVRSVDFYQDTLRNPTFYPTREMISLPPDGDLTIIFLSAGRVLFSRAEYDPWYNANKYQENVGMGSSFNISSDPSAPYIPVYMQNEPASPLACKQQHQFCNRNLPGDDNTQCTPLTTLLDSAVGAVELFPDGTPHTGYGGLGGGQERFYWAMQTIFGSSVEPSAIIAALGSQILQSRTSLSTGMQAPLAENQWQLDMQYMYSTGLASLQQAVVNTATGVPAGKNLEQFYRGPSDDVERELCQNLKIRSTAYLSFSLFGIYFTFILGGIIILVSYTLDPLMSCLRSRYGIRVYQQLEWATNEVLQLQRLAHEEVGMGTWDGVAAVPTTLSGEKLATLDLSDVDHPRLLSTNGQVSGHQVQEKVAWREVQSSEQNLLHEATPVRSTTNTDQSSERGYSLSDVASRDGLPSLAPMTSSLAQPIAEGTDRAQNEESLDRNHLSKVVQTEASMPAQTEGSISPVSLSDDGQETLRATLSQD